MSNNGTETSADQFVIAHATNLEKKEKIAFEHAVALGLRARGALYAVHATHPGSEPELKKMPQVDELVTRWQAADRPLGADLGERIDYHTVMHTCCDDPVDTLLDALDDINPDLLVVGKHRAGQIESFFHDSVSESLARNTGRPTLFVPLGGPGFIDFDDGDLEIDRVVVPVLDQETLLESFDQIRRIFETLKLTGIEFDFVHVGGDDEITDAVVPETDEQFEWHTFESDGGLRAAIEEVVERRDADLIAMGTHGHDSLADVFQGTKTEQIIRLMPRPVLSFPLS